MRIRKDCIVKRMQLEFPNRHVVVAVVVVVYFIWSRSLAYSVNLGLLCMPHPGMGPLV